MLFLERLAPRAALARILDDRVSWNVSEHFSQLDPIGNGEEESEYVSPADYRNWLPTRQLEHLGDVVSSLRAVGVPARVARQHDVTPTWQKARQALECLAPHDHRASHSERLEAPQIGRQVPWQLALAADYAVLSTGNDKGNGRLFHAITLAVSRLGAKRANAAS